MDTARRLHEARFRGLVAALIMAIGEDREGMYPRWVRGQCVGALLYEFFGEGE